MPMRHLGTILFAALLAPLITHAQTLADPLDPALRSSAAPRVSPFADYRRYEEDQPVSWRELNDQVLKLGGHAGHVKDADPREVREGATPSSSMPRPVPSAPHTIPAPGGQLHHKH